MKKQSKISKEEFLKLYKSGLNDKQIAEKMNQSPSTICYFRNNILNLRPVADTIELSNDELEVLAGTLLGDSSILYVHKGCRYPHIQFSHSVSQREYFDNKYKALERLMSSYGEYNYRTKTVIKGRECRVHPILHGVGRNLKCLISLREVFYPEGKKIIPVDYISNIFTAKSLAYLFMDDGCKNQNSINLNLQCFETENLQEFVKFLYNKFNLEFVLKKDKTLYLRYKSVNNFLDLVAPYIIDAMKYKLPCRH